MKGLLICLIAIFFSTVAAFAQIAERPVLNVSISPTEAVKTHGYTGGQLIMTVRLISRHPFEELSLTMPRIAGAEVIELVSPRTRKLSGYAGEGFQHVRVLAVLPRGNGTLEIPAVLAAGVAVSTTGTEIRFDLASDPLLVDVDPAPATYSSDWWFVSPDVQISESWSVPVDQIRIGTMVQRRVNLVANGVTAEQLPQLAHGRVLGARVSLRSSHARTEKTIDGLIASAEYVWDFEAEQNQIIFVRPMGVIYWDPLEHREKSVALPGHRIEPLPADVAATAAALMREAADNRKQTMTVATAMAAFLLAPFILLLVFVLAHCLPTRADLRLWSACNPNASAETIYLATHRWLAEIEQSTEAAQSHLSALRDLSDWLFAPGHPPAFVHKSLRSQALRWSRRTRLQATFRILNPAPNPN